MSAAPPAPGVWLRRVTVPERKYLRRALGTAPPIIFPILGVLAFASVFASDPLLGHNAGNNPQVSHWLHFLYNLASFAWPDSIFVGVFAAIAVMFPLRVGATARFYRTRPLGIGFLYWANILIALGIVLVTCASITGVLLLAMHGDWPQVPPIASAPRVLISICTTAALSLGVFAVWLAIPYSRLSGQNTTCTIALFLGMFVFACLFFVVYFKLGQPLSYALVPVPVALSAGLFLLARFLVGKSEV